MAKKLKEFLGKKNPLLKSKADQDVFKKNTSSVITKNDKPTKNDDQFVSNVSVYDREKDHMGTNDHPDTVSDGSNLNEVSNKLINRYLDRAGKDNEKRHEKIGKHFDRGNFNAADKMTKKYDNRKGHIDKAIKRWKGYDDSAWDGYDEDSKGKIVKIKEGKRLSRLKKVLDHEALRPTDSLNLAGYGGMAATAIAGSSPAGQAGTVLTAAMLARHAYKAARNYRRLRKNKDHPDTELKEISKETLKKYISVASIDKSNRAHEIGYQNALGVSQGRPRDAKFHKDNKEHGKRSLGIQKAAERLGGSYWHKRKERGYLAKESVEESCTRKELLSKHHEDSMSFLDQIKDLMKKNHSINKKSKYIDTYNSKELKRRLEDMHDDLVSRTDQSHHVTLNEGFSDFLGAGKKARLKDKIAQRSAKYSKLAKDAKTKAGGAGLGLVLGVTTKVVKDDPAKQLAWINSKHGRFLGAQAKLYGDQAKSYKATADNKAGPRFKSRFDRLKQLDELSRKTLLSYKGKAVDQADKERVKSYSAASSKDRVKAKRLADKRSRGAGHATARLNNEEYLDEISKKTLKSYIEKADKSEKRHAKKAHPDLHKDGEHHYKKMAKRQYGMAVAKEKLKKQLDEKAGIAGLIQRAKIKWKASRKAKKSPTATNRLRAQGERVKFGDAYTEKDKLKKGSKQGKKGNLNAAGRKKRDRAIERNSAPNKKSSKKASTKPPLKKVKVNADGQTLHEAIRALVKRPVFKKRINQKLMKNPKKVS